MTVNELRPAPTPQAEPPFRAQDRSELLHRLSTDLTRGLTREQVSQVVVRHIIDALGGYGGGIIELTDNGTMFQLLGIIGHSREVSQQFARFPSDSPLPVGDVVRTREPIFLESLEEWIARYPQPPAIPKGSTNGSWVALPLQVDGHLLGTLTVSLPESRRIPPDERRFMLTYAELCAQALERARLFEDERAARLRSERITERVVALQAVTSALGAARSRSEVGDVITRIGLSALGASRGALALLNAAGDRLELAVSTGYPPDVRHRFESMPLESPLPFCDCVRGDETIVLSTRADREARYPHLHFARDEQDQGALLAMPLRTDGRVVGALGANWEEPREFDREDRDFLTALADQAAQAIERARLNEAERVAREEASAAHQRAEFLSETTRQLASSLEFEQTVAAVANAFVPRLADWCAIDMLAHPERAAWPPELERVVVMHANPARIAWAESVRARHVVRWDAGMGLPEVLRTGESWFIPNIDRAAVRAWARTPAETELAEEMTLTSYLCVPMRAGGRTLGAITLCMDESSRRFTDSDRLLAEQVAHRAATAIEHARLLRDAEQARTEAEEARQAAEEARVAADVAREAAERANRVKAEFLTIMSHELRTPLNAIGGYAELMQLGIRGPLTNEQALDLSRIQRSQRHLLGMINEVLNYARLESGSVKFAIAPISIALAFSEVEPLVLPQAQAKRLRLDFEACDPAISALADAEKLQQILVNLLSNAVKFTDAGGSITMSCMRKPREESDVVRIVVHDTGSGIPPEQLQRIFEPFVQLDRSRYSPGEGAGLGLAISRDLARGMGGDLTGESDVGVGSAFTLTLPGAPPSTQPSQPPTPPHT